MDKFDFINRIISLYPHAITDKQAQYDTYSHSLPVSERVDYNEVFSLYCKEYKDSFPPPPGQICEWAKNCIKSDYNPEKKWLQVKVYNPVCQKIRDKDVFPAGTSEEAMIKTYEKLFPGTKGWKIIEVW